MKLDANALRYLDRDEWRVLTAVEIGQKSHSIVPTVLIESIAKLKHGGVYQKLSNCLKHKLVHHEASSYDGYRLTTLGYDFLAIHTLTKRGVICSVGRQIGVGKESDIFEVAAEDGTIMALKLHRLGRTSFRAVKDKRDYLRKGNHYSWLYLSRLAAIKEYAFMKALGERGLPVPTAIDQNRHAVLMEKVEGLQLAQVRDLEDPANVFEQMVDILCSMTSVGLVHCDFNEFNVLLCDDGRLIAIDFPQMVSISHANAKALFERDLNCIIRFFTQKLKYNLETDSVPCWETLMEDIDARTTVDVELHASGFNNVEHDSTAMQRTRSSHLPSGCESEADSDATGESTCTATGAHEPQAAVGACEDSMPSRWEGDVGGSTAHVQAGSGASSDGEGTHGAGDAISGADDPEEPGRQPHQVTSSSGSRGLASAGVELQTEVEPGDYPNSSPSLKAEQAGKQEAHQAAMAKLQKSRRSQAQRQARAKMTRNETKTKGRKARVSVLDV